MLDGTVFQVNKAYGSILVITISYSEMVSASILLVQNYSAVLGPGCTDKKENNFLIYREIQMGSGAKSYMRKGFLIDE